MPPLPVWIEEVQINHVEGDYYRKWRLSSLFLALQEAAAHHATNLEAGYDELQVKNLAWVLSRFKIRFEAFPFAGERVTITTWPKGVHQKLFFVRDFLITGEKSGRIYARAGSSWLMINTRTRRMERPNVLALDLPGSDGRSGLDEPLERITVRGEMQEQFRLQARPSMLDLMGHVTSARYLEWVVDCFPVQAFQNDALAWLQINFNHEVRPDEQVSIACGRTPGQEDTWFVQGINLNSGANAFEAALGFRGK
jgi:medium-chain acyl-[acyl-carrier-protein] hydrolase